MADVMSRQQSSQGTAPYAHTEDPVSAPERELRLDIPSSWRFIKTIRSLVEDALRHQDDSVRHAGAMVASELVGNAIKFSGSSAPGPTFLLRVAPERIEIAVSNVVRHVEQLAQVTQRIDQLASAANKQVFYLARLHELLAGASQGSQLGLYRIGYEGEFELGYSYSGGTLTVRALRTLC